MKKHLDFFKNAAKTGTAKDTSIVFIGQIVSTVISAVFFFIIARFLGPAKLGIYSVVAALVLILSDTIDLSLNSSIIKFSSHQDKDSYLKFAFLIKFAVGLLILMVMFFGSEIISVVLKQNLNDYLKTASLLVLLTFLYRFPKSVFQGQKKFAIDVSLDIGLSVLRLLVVFYLIFTNSLTINGIFWSHNIATLVFFLLGFYIVGFDFLKAKINGNLFRSFFSFQGWLGLGFIVAAIHSRLDNLFLIRLAGPATVGFYQAGYRFFLPVNQFTSVLSTVFAPRFASFKTDIEVKTYLKKSTLLSAFMALLLILVIPFFPFLIRLFYGIAYENSIVSTQILAFGFAGFVLSTPFTSCLLYRLGKTNIFFILNIVQISLLIALDLMLIPGWQASGAAWAVSISMWVIALCYIYFVYKRFKTL